MEPKIDVACSRSASDVRDYTLVDALSRLSKQQGENLKFATWDTSVDKKWASLDGTPPDQKNNFLEYKVSVKSPSQSIQLNSHTVLIPLSFSYLEKEKAFTLELSESGNMILKDAGDGYIGKIIARQGSILIVDANGDYISGELVVTQNGKVSINRAEDELNLYLGQGFRQYTLNNVYWSPVEDQRGILCGANAGVAMLEYFERVSEGRHFNASRLFLHQAACHIMRVPLDSAVSVRAIVSALTMIGVPPEEYWPNDLTKLTQEPPTWCYAYARNYRATSYLRLDRPDMTKEALIAQIKVFIYSGLPVIFGFSVHESIQQSFIKQPLEGLLNEKTINLFKAINENKNSSLKLLKSFLNVAEKVVKSEDFKQRFTQEGQIPFPTFGEIYQGGHAVVAIGYDDERIIINSSPLGQKDRELIKRALLRKKNSKGQDTWIECIWMRDKGIYCQGKEIDFNTFRFLDDKDFDGKFIQLILKPEDENTCSGTATLEPESLQPSANITARNADKLSVKEHLVTKGAFKIRNSWGQEWGDNGYGWLPYAYVYSDLTFDWWSILKFEWINTNDFGLLRNNDDLVMCNPLTCPTALP